MAEQGQITFTVGVDSGEAIRGLQDLQDGLVDMGKDAGKAGTKVSDSFDEIDDSAKKNLRSAQSETKKTKKALSELADEAKASGKKTTDALDQKDTIDGLDSLQDKSGELDSSLKGLAGAVGLVSPEMEVLLMRTGDLSGGFEASARLATLSGGSMKSLMLAGGALGVAVAALGGTYMIFSKQLKVAEENLKQSHKEMEAGIAFAKQYKDQLQGLQNSVGLLSDEEFALIDARRRSTQFMKEQIEAERAQRSVINQITDEIENQKAQLEKFIEMESKAIRGSFKFEMQQYDVAEALRLTQEQIEAGEPILADNGRSTEVLGDAYISSGEAAQMARDNIENLEGSLSRYQNEIEGTERKTERLNLLFQIQSAQAHDDADAISQLALKLAVLDDTETRLFVSTVKAAKALALLHVQSLNLGAGTAAAIAGVERMFSKFEQTAAPRAFQETLAALSTELDTTTESTNASTAALEKRRDVQAEIAAQMAEEQAMREAGQAAVALEISDREKIKEAYKQQRQELEDFLSAGAISQEQYFIKIKKLNEDEASDLLAHDVAVFQSRLATAQAFTNQLESLQDARAERRMQKLEQEETNALALASGSEEAQAAVRAEFEARRKEELNKAFKDNQRTQIASAIMSGANAAIGALAPPPTGLGPNAAGLAMAAFVGTTTAAQVGVIANQQPSFHQGGIIGGQGDQMITAQGGEAILNKAAVASLGGEAGVDSLNQGGAAGGGVVVQMVYKQRVLDELIVDNLAKGGPLRRAIDRSGRRARRGRIGGRL